MNNVISKESKVDELFQSIGKSEALVEQHDEALEEIEKQSEDLEGWILIIIKAVKNILLR